MWLTALQRTIDRPLTDFENLLMLNAKLGVQLREKYSNKA